MPHPAEAYFTQPHASLGVGVPETSGYPALANLLNAVGNSFDGTYITRDCHAEKQFDIKRFSYLIEPYHT